ncbi:hypothetical protein BDZ85DRAFT_267703 [Elsinoe ampelina]|uniref:Uncharacterized protein n=2 Tax=Elsinoe TaxID=40996 RepID=A0A8K0L8J1_9PEZI|nr:hypothetical protein BDZ85DRAFT_267703 [Elsinoe ampelina]KAG8630474.1 hypothetical protein KVT40_002093 [Elsinoe batatas]
MPRSWRWVIDTRDQWKRLMSSGNNGPSICECTYDLGDDLAHAKASVGSGIAVPLAA